MVHRSEAQPLSGRPILFTEALMGHESVATARDAVRQFLIEVQAVHGIPVSARVMGMVQLVVSELVTNAYKYAPGPCLLELEIRGEGVEVSVWDADPTLPVIGGVDPGRVGKHGLEIVTGVCRFLELRREPVGKRIKAVIMLADDPGRRPVCLVM
ncbi:ATP-binding protein [Streptomyces sp. NPDC055239]